MTTHPQFSLVLMATAEEPSTTETSPSVEEFLEERGLAQVNAHKIQVTEAQLLAEPIASLIAKLSLASTPRGTGGDSGAPESQASGDAPLLIVTSPRTAEFLTPSGHDPVLGRVHQLLKAWAPRLTFAGVGPSTTAKLHEVWGPRGAAVQRAAAHVGLQACLEGLQASARGLRPPVIIVGAAGGTSERIARQWLPEDCFFGIYENVAAQDLTKDLHEILEPLIAGRDIPALGQSDTSPLIPQTASSTLTCACVCSSGAAVRAMIPCLKNLLQEPQHSAQPGTLTFVIYPRGASAELALAQAQLPPHVLSCDDGRQ